MLTLRLRDISEVITKGTTPTTVGYAFEESGINFIKVESIDEEGYFVAAKIAKISQECNEKLKRSQLKKGDILISIAGAIGRVAIVNDKVLPANINQALALVRIKDERLNLRYLKKILQSEYVTKQYEIQKQGVAQLNLSLKNVGDIVVPVPSIEDQQRIANEFDKVSGLIEKRQKQLEKLDLLIKSRFVEMFQCGSKNKIQLQSICEICSSKRIFEKEYVEDGVPFYRTKEIVELSCGKEISTELFIGYEKYIEIKKNYSVPMKNDLLITAIGTIGVIWIVNDESEFYFKDGNILWIKASEKFNSIFMKELLVNEIKNYKNKMVAGTAYMALTIAGLKNMEINLPPMELQNQFADFVEKVEQNKSKVKNSLDKLITLKKALMQKYFG